MSQYTMAAVCYAAVYAATLTDARQATANRERKLKGRNQYVYSADKTGPEQDGKWNAEHATRYVWKVLSSHGSTSATDGRETVREGNATWRRDAEKDKYSSQTHVKGVSTHDVEDICQSAFLIWWKRRTKKEACTLRKACKYAIGRHFRQLANTVRGQQEGYGETDARTERRKREMSGGASKNSNVNKPGFRLNELTPFQPTKTDEQAATLARVLSTGGTMTDAAALLGVQQPRASKIASGLREQLDYFPLDKDGKRSDIPALPEPKPFPAGGMSAAQYANREPSALFTATLPLPKDERGLYSLPMTDRGMWYLSAGHVPCSLSTYHAVRAMPDMSGTGDGI